MPAGQQGWEGMQGLWEPQGPWDQGAAEEQKGRMLLLARWGQGLRISLAGCSVLA